VVWGWGFGVERGMGWRGGGGGWREACEEEPTLGCPCSITNHRPRRRRTLMLNPAFALVSMKLTASSRALASPSSSDTCLRGRESWGCGGPGAHVCMRQGASHDRQCTEDATEGAPRLLLPPLKASSRSRAHSHSHHHHSPMPRHAPHP